MSKMGMLFKKFLVVTVEYIKVLKVRYKSKVITGFFFFFGSTKSANILG